MARIIDDDAGVRLMIRLVLEGAGDDVVDAVDGMDVLGTEEAAPADLILCDVFMPGVGGLAGTCRRNLEAPKGGPRAMLRMLPLLVILLAHLPVWAGAETDGFINIPWGADQVSIRSRPGWRFCDDLSHDSLFRQRGDARCVVTIFPDGFGGVRAEAHYFLRHGAGVRWVLVKFAPKDFERVRNLFVEWYGEPTASSIAPKPHKAGPFEMAEWRGDSTRVVLIGYGLGEQSRAYIGLSAEVEAELDRIAKGQTEVLAPTVEDMMRWQMHQMRRR